MGKTLRFLLLTPALIFALPSGGADRALEPGWSAVPVRVIEYETGQTVAGARIETTCNGSVYKTERETTGADGRATVPIYRSWVALKVTHPAFTNSTVILVGTNKVASFCRDAVIKMGRGPK
jgi:hypothetical protein